jgi:PAS domain S-box-containing protein
MRVMLSLRERLVVLVVGALLPLSALTVWFAVQDVREATAAARAQLKFAASLVAANQDRTVEAAEHLLGAIAAMEQMRSPERRVCEKYFESLRGHYPIYANIGILDTNGNMLCHVNGRFGNFNMADRPFFKRALAERRFVMGVPMVGLATGRLIIPFARPVFDGAKIVAVAFVGLDLQNASAQLGKLDLPGSAQVIVTDRGGVVLMSHPPRLPGAQATVANPAVVDAARRLEGGSGEWGDASGEQRMYAYAPSRAVASQGFMAVVSIGRDAVIGASIASLRGEIIALGLTVLAGLLVAWWFGGRVIVKPAKQILGAVRRLEQGLLDARVPLQHGGPQRGEFARIGAAFNLMAESLQLRQLDLETELGRSRGAYAVLDQVLNGMQEALVAMNGDGELLLHNEAARRLFPIDQPVPPERRPGAWGLYRADRETLFRANELPLARALRGESGSLFTIYVRNAQVPQGRLVQCSYQPLKGERGITAALVVYTDVTELQRLQAEQAVQFDELRETQRKLVEAQRIGGIGNWELELAAGRLGWSDEVYELFGVSRDEFVPTLQAFERLVHPQDRHLLKPARDQALRDGQPLSIEYRVVKADGAIAWMHEIGEARRNEIGEPVWFGGVVQDITARKRNERENARLFAEISELNAGLEARIAERTAELTRQERLYRTLAEQAPEVVWNTDAQGAATFLNRAWYDLVGGSPGDWLGHGWLDRIHPDDLAAVQRNWAQAQATLQPYSGTRRVHAQDGSYHTMSYKAAPVLGDDGQVAFWVGIDTDITSLKAIERALRGTNQELEAFSYSVSHDLRAPLGAIAGFSKALANKIEGQADERTLHYLSRIQAGVVKMEQLIDALLSLAKVARAKLDWGPVDLGAIAREIADDLRAQQPERQVQFDIQEGLEAHGDARMLRVMLQNLVGNAWKFTSHQDEARIEVGRQSEGSVFFVRDNGVGFDMAYASKLFIAFQRLHTESEFPGTGIGLATVRRIVARHQGKVWAESQPGEITTFFFTLSDSAPPSWLEPGA